MKGEIEGVSQSDMRTLYIFFIILFFSACGNVGTVFLIQNHLSICGNGQTELTGGT